LTPPQVRDECAVILVNGPGIRLKLDENKLR
jgi:hypothetical protein